jgi:hypothetical protein
LFIVVLVSSQKSKRSCICVFGKSILPISRIFSVGFWNCSDNVVNFLYHFIRKQSVAYIFIASHVYSFQDMALSILICYWWYTRKGGQIKWLVQNKKCISKFEIYFFLRFSSVRNLGFNYKTSQFLFSNLEYWCFDLFYANCVNEGFVMRFKQGSYTWHTSHCSILYWF